MGKLNFINNQIYNSGLFHTQKTNTTNNGLLLFHQGWTDIINCLSLINICSKRYTILYAIFREDATEIINYYIRDLKNVIPVYIPKKTLDKGEIEQYIKTLPIDNYEYFGGYDSGRIDKYKNAYSNLIQKGIHPFEKLFYVSYDIPYSQRFSEFEISRNIELENEVYDRLYTNQKYICTHTNPELQLYVNPNSTQTYHVIELNKSSNIFFDMIKVLENASEIHVIDSVWAAICYLIDCRYRLFENVQVYVYCHRGFHRMFEDPLKLPNWTIIT
jgi:hypothetical protein